MAASRSLLPEESSSISNSSCPSLLQQFQATLLTMQRLKNLFGRPRKSEKEVNQNVNFETYEPWLHVLTYTKL